MENKTKIEERIENIIWFLNYLSEEKSTIKIINGIMETIYRSGTHTNGPTIYLDNRNLLFYTGLQCEAENLERQLKEIDRSDTFKYTKVKNDFSTKVLEVPLMEGIDKILGDKKILRFKIKFCLYDENFETVPRVVSDILAILSTIPKDLLVKITNLTFPNPENEIDIPATIFEEITKNDIPSKIMSILSFGCVFRCDWKRSAAVANQINFFREINSLNPNYYSYINKSGDLIPGQNVCTAFAERTGNEENRFIHSFSF